MKSLKSKYGGEIDLAKLIDFDIWLEDHGSIMFSGHFDYDGTCQGLANILTIDFIRKFMEVFNVECLREVNGKKCFVEHTHSKIYRLIPLRKDEGTEFDIAEYITRLEKEKE